MTRGVTRRRVLQQAGVIGSLVWTAPAVRSVQVGDTAGSPPPGSTTTIPSTSLALVGSFGGPRTIVHPPGDCFIRQAATLTGDLSGFGASTLTLTICFGPLANNLAPVLGESFTLSTAGGAIDGTIASGAFDIGGLGPFPIDMDLSVRGGSGEFHDATGVATLHGFANGSTYDFTLAGTLELPG